jgi:hypothetical protein
VREGHVAYQVIFDTGPRGLGAYAQLGHTLFDNGSDKNQAAIAPYVLSSS